MRKKNAKIKAFLLEHRGALILMALLLTVRLLGLYSLGLNYSLNSDDMSYIKSGIHFAETGMITMHDAYPSAQIMPGMTVLIGIIYLIVGRGTPLWLTLKLLWLLMGTLTAWFIYRSVRVFAPKWCGLLAILPLFRADFIWMDNLILAETPFMLALTALIYFTLMMGKRPGWRYFWGAALCYMAGLMLKANIALYPLFALAYLLALKYDGKLLFRQCVVLACVVLCFVVPWSVRNYVQFHAFVPLTYGAGNPTLLGTYQGVGYPSDEELDYETNVEQVVREKCARYYQEDGQVQPRYARYVLRRADAVKAAYRQRVWAEKDLGSILYSYLVLKPKMMVNDIFYWERVLNIKGSWMLFLQRLDTWLCVLSVLLSLVLKKHRKAVLFLAAAYSVNVYIYAMTFAFGRYNASLMSFRFILIGIGIGLIAEFTAKRVLKTKI